ncbi:MAG: OmpA family protein, partial [Pyrinomonadaceae bacterium]|nr:OmpA family protein [Pyrinomonadaceae bacterium]
MFGLDGKPALFDELFEQANSVWVKRGYISQLFPAREARDSTLLKAIYMASTESLQAKGFKPPDENIKKRQPVSTKHVYINFDPGSAELNDEAKRRIDEDIAFLAQTNSNAYIRIEGFADPGFNAPSSSLGLARAQAIANYLVEKYKWDANRFIVAGNGPDRLPKPNPTEPGHDTDRRIDIGIVPLN